MIVLTVLAIVLAALTLPGTIELLVLTLAGLLPPRRFGPPGAGSFRLAIVVPAHNEEAVIHRCLSSLLSAERDHIHVTVAVVADNCSDATARIAEAAGARVLIRVDAARRGKGYALDFAFQALLPEGYDAFVVVDADSQIAPGFIREMAGAFLSGADAVQCRYLVRNRAESVRTRLMNVALYAFNVLRPRGRDRLGLSCGIYGNGFGISAPTLRAVPYTAASVVEDLEYHLALVKANRRVWFVDATAVYGDMPVAGEGVKTQRARWEGGRFRMIASKSPELLLEVLRGRLRLLEPLLDLLLLPLAFHVTFLLLISAIPVPAARVIGLTGIAVVMLHLVAAIKVGSGSIRDVLVLAAAPLYVLWKLLLLPKVLSNARAGASWVRTERVRGKLP